MKGVASYFHQNQSAASEGMSFASAMAASPEEWKIANEGKSTKSFTSLNYTLFILLRLGLCW